MDDDLADERARMRDTARRVFAERRGAVELLAAHDRGEPVEIDLDPFRALDRQAVPPVPTPAAVTSSWLCEPPPADENGRAAC